MSRDAPSNDGDQPTQMFVQADSAALPLPDSTIDVIITSPPYNLHNRWTSTQSTQQSTGGYFDERRENEYRVWQQRILTECGRVARHGASLFYVHKVRASGGEVMHPIDWLTSDENPWRVRQEIVWQHDITPDHDRALFEPVDDRVYWLTKGTPSVPPGGIDMKSVWQFSGSRADASHPAPFPIELPKRCLEAVGTDGDVVLDPMCGSMTTCKAARELGYPSIGVDITREYVTSG